MRATFLTRGPVPGAAAHFRTLGMASELARSGHDIRLIADDLPENRNLGQHIDPSIELLVVRKLRASRRVLGWRRAIRDEADDVFIIALNPTLEVFLALMTSRGRFVAEWDEPPSLKPMGRLRRVFTEMIETALSRRAAVNIAAAPDLCRVVEARSKRSVAFIPHGMYLETQAEAVVRLPARAVVYLGNFYPLWDHDVVLDAALELARGGCKPAIVMIGEGPELGSARAYCQANQLDNVLFLGRVATQDLLPVLRQAHCLLLPLRDTLVNRTRCPSKALAYLQARRPVIVSRVGVTESIFGDRAFYSEGTPSSFAAAIRSVVDAEAPDLQGDLERFTYANLAVEFQRAVVRSA